MGWHRAGRPVPAAQNSPSLLDDGIYQPCLLKIDEVAYVDKGRNLAVALGERDVKVRNQDDFYFFSKIVAKFMRASVLCKYFLK